MTIPHIRERFFQRYGRDLDVNTIRELITLASKTRGKPNNRPEAEEVTVCWQGHSVRMVWVRSRRFILTFLPEPGMLRARYINKRRRP